METIEITPRGPFSLAGQRRFPGPYRSWVALLLRAHREQITHEIARGRTAHPA